MSVSDPRPRPLIQEMNVIEQQFVLQCVRFQNLVNNWLCGYEIVSGDDVRAAFRATEAVESALSAVAAVSADVIAPEFTKAGEDFLRNARVLADKVPGKVFGTSEALMEVDYAGICAYNYKCLNALNVMFQTA